MAHPVTRSQPLSGPQPMSGMTPFGYPQAQAAGVARPPMLSRLTAALGRTLGVASRKGTLTSEGGVAGSASPAVSGMTHQKQIWDRRALNAEMWGLYQADSNFRQAVEKHVHKATAAGFSLSIKARPGTSSVKERRATVEAEAMLRRVGLLGGDGRPDKALMAKYLRHGRLEADLFVQHVIAYGADGEGEVTGLKVMPSAAMERLSDDLDRFPDPACAFRQVDVNTQQVVTGPDGRPAVFADFQIGHHRWKRLGEDRYGQFEYAAARQQSTNLAVTEMHQRVRRRQNSARIIDHAIGGDPTDKDIETYKAKNTIAEGAAARDGDPFVQLESFFHGDETTITVHQSDPNIHEIADIVYQEQKSGAANGTPIQLLGLNLDGMTRDTLDLIVSEWIDGMDYDLAWVYGVILTAVRLQLRLKGISPDAFDIGLAVPKRAFETAAEAVAFVNKMMANTLGAGMNAKPYPLLTPEAAVRLLAEYIGVGDAAGYVKDLEAMMAEKHMDADTVHGMQVMGADSGVQNGSANSKTPGGGASTGRGQRFEDGKVKDGSRSGGGDSYKKLP